MSRSDREGVARRWARRAISFSAVALAWSFALLGLVGLPVTLGIDIMCGSRFAWARAQLALLVFLTCEVAGLVGAGGLWLARPLMSRERWLGSHSRLQRRWVRALFGGLRRLYGISLVVEGQGAIAEEGPLVVLVRHTSLVDTLVPVLLLEGWRLRYVLKQELLWDPCLDVVGQRLPNAFVRRASGAPGAQIDRITELATGLGRRDAAVIFPEGTRFTRAKRQRILASLARTSNAAKAARARELRHVLPPRLGGTQALLSASPAASVLLLNHSGLERVRTLACLWNGELIDKEIRVRLEFVPAARVPREPELVETWLWDAWRGVDAWIAASPERAALADAA